LQKPKENIKQIGEFLGLSCDQVLVDSIADKCNFSKMKEGKTEVELIMYRKGITLKMTRYNIKNYKKYI